MPGALRMATPSIVIGVTDDGFDFSNPDLNPKIVLGAPGVPSYHGTKVAGLIAAATDNDTGYAAIGFDCMLELSPVQTDDKMQEMSAARIRKILNGSWYDTVTANYTPGDRYLTELQYREIYENGTLSCFAAGNGPDIGTPANWFSLPASFDYVFSTTGGGWEGTYPPDPSTGDTFDVTGLHEIYAGDTVNTYQHNNRVDIMAPAVRITGLDYNNVPGHYFDDWSSPGQWGTSFASPLVAGTAGLILSANNCLSPYQIEYFLKTYANDTVLTLPENIKYAGKLGAGMLDAGKSVTMASAANGFNCNEITTQTFYIKGIELNSRCKPGVSSNGVKPVLTPVMVNGAPPYTYRWVPISNGAAVNGNNTFLSSDTAAQPTIDSAYGNNLAFYNLTVYDASPVQKVASVIVKILLDTATAANKYDLAMRDSYVDMGNEPNTQALVDPYQWDIWNSPDIWNRNDSDGIEEHQNPTWSSTVTDSNYMYVRVRNIGCISSHKSILELYWTLASSGEHWIADWNGNNYIQGASSLIPTGGVISSGFFFPVINPGDAAILRKAWRMPYGIRSVDTTATTMAVCGLAKMREVGKPNFGLFQSALSANTSDDVDSNNNIVTRNMVVVTLANQTPWKTFETIPLIVNNPDTLIRNYTLQLITDKDIHKHFSGNISQYVYGTIKLPTNVWNHWWAAGHHGTYGRANATTHTISYDPATPLRLDNVPLSPDQPSIFTLTLTLRGIPIPDDVAPGVIHYRQLLETDSTETVCGNVSIAVNFVKDKPDDCRKAQPAAGRLTTSFYTVYPNPVSNTLTISFTGATNETATIAVADITGKVLIRKQGLSFKAGAQQQLDVSKLTPGIYIVHITASGGTEETYKVNKN